MTETNDVAVVCLGICDKQGFALSPVGYEPTFVEFKPGEPLVMAKHYADYLMASDPHKFVKAEKQAAKKLK